MKTTYLNLCTFFYSKKKILIKRLKIAIFIFLIYLIFLSLSADSIQPIDLANKLEDHIISIIDLIKILIRVLIFSSFLATSFRLFELLRNKIMGENKAYWVLDRYVIAIITIYILAVVGSILFNGLNATFHTTVFPEFETLSF